MSIVEAMQLDGSVEEPLNREPPVPELISDFITQKGNYDRNHGAIPHIDGERHVLRVDGAVDNVLEVSMLQLKDDFEQHEVICALQCAGNRRHTMRTLLKEVNGIDWFDGAVMNCIWKGPRVADILKRAGIRMPLDEKAHVAFACMQMPCQEDDWYGGSTELSRVMDPDADVILALEASDSCVLELRMNGQPLPVNHGYPVRAVVPGVAGARCVKWLDRITVQEDESPNYYQRHDYKILPPDAVDAETAEKYWDTIPALQDMPVNSVVGLPQSGETVPRGLDGTISVKGYALPSGNHGPVTRVEVSADEGKTWTDAELIHSSDGNSKWAWKLWQAAVKVEPGCPKIIFSRATDAGGNVQPASSQWNLRGVAYNGYGEARDLTVV